MHNGNIRWTFSLVFQLHKRHTTFSFGTVLYWVPWISFCSLKGILLCWNYKSIGLDMLQEQLCVLMNADTLNRTYFLLNQWWSGWSSEYWRHLRIISGEKNDFFLEHIKVFIKLFIKHPREYLENFINGGRLLDKIW